MNKFLFLLCLHMQLLLFLLNCLHSPPVFLPLFCFSPHLSGQGREIKAGWVFGCWLWSIYHNLFSANGCLHFRKRRHFARPKQCIIYIYIYFHSSTCLWDLLKLSRKLKEHVFLYHSYADICWCYPKALSQQNIYAWRYTKLNWSWVTWCSFEVGPDFRGWHELR